MLSASHLSDSRIHHTFAARVLTASPWSVTSTSSDDECSRPTNTPGWNRGSHFPPLADLGGMHKIFSPNSRIGALSLRPCNVCVYRRLSVAADVAPVHQIRSELHQPAQYPCVGQDSAPAQPSVFWPGHVHVRQRVQWDHRT